MSADVKRVDCSTHIKTWNYNSKRTINTNKIYSKETKNVQNKTLIKHYMTDNIMLYTEIQCLLKSFKNIKSRRRGYKKKFHAQLS